MKRGMRHPHDPEWLKEIPSAWQVAALRRCVHVESTGSAPIKNTVELAPGPDLVPAFSASGQDVWVAPCQGKRFSGPGLVISAVGARCGKTFFADGVWSVVANTSVLRVRRGNSTRYFWYLLNDEEFWIRGESAQPYVQVQPSLSKKIPVPPLPEQQRIAAFLDRETTKIDSLVAELTGFAETLRARDKSLIAECVTQGVPSRRAGRTMVDSGVEWIGEVPEGWETWNVGQVFNNEKVLVNDKQFPPLSVTKRGVVPQLDSVAKSDKTDERKRVLPGQFVINSRSDRRGSSGLSVHAGSVSLVYLVLQPKDISAHMPYFHYLLRSHQFTSEYYRLGSGVADDIRTTGWQAMKAIRLPLPAVAEQADIADYLGSELAKSAALLAEVENQVNLLKAYRKSLISEAVTGKIAV